MVVKVDSIRWSPLDRDVLPLVAIPRRRTMIHLGRGKDCLSDCTKLVPELARKELQETCRKDGAAVRQ